MYNIATAYDRGLTSSSSSLDFEIKKLVFDVFAAAAAAAAAAATAVDAAAAAAPPACLPQGIFH